MTKNTSKQTSRRRLSLLALEPRIVFDGAMPVTDPALLNPADHNDTAALLDAATRAVSLALPKEASSRREIVFVDDALSDLPGLLAGIGSHAQVVQIQHGQDGLSQINAALAGQAAFDAIHIIAHGSEGVQTIGATTLDASHLDALKAELAALGNSLSAEGDLLLYGCDVAQSAQGVAFIEKLAQLTGADVAASLNRTGSGLLAADWQLESASGTVEARALQAPEWLQVLSGSLSVDNVTVQENGGGLTVNGQNRTPMEFTVSGTPGELVSLDWANQSTSSQDIDSTYASGSPLQYKTGGVGVARYVRLEKSGEFLSLAEVQVISGGLNLAPTGTATQSSDGWGGTADKAIDDNTSGEFGDGTVTHTGGGDANPWWQLDLGQSFSIEVINIFNRNSSQDRLDGVTIKLLDAQGTVLAQSTLNADLQQTWALGSSWQPYTGPVALGADGTMKVRLAVVDDALSEANETLTLTATAGVQSATGVGTVADNDPLLPMVSDLTVNEGSPYAVFQVTGLASAGLQLDLLDGSAQPADHGVSMAFFNNTTRQWVAYNAAVPNAVLGVDGQLLVRVAIVNDSTFEGLETFKLQAAYTGSGVPAGLPVGSPAEGTATLVDNGMGLVFGEGNTSGSPDVPGLSADVSVPAVLDLDPMPDSACWSVAHADMANAFTLAAGQSIDWNSLDLDGSTPGVQPVLDVYATLQGVRTTVGRYVVYQNGISFAPTEAYNGSNAPDAVVTANIVTVQTGANGQQVKTVVGTQSVLLSARTQPTPVDGSWNQMFVGAGNTTAKGPTLSAQTITLQKDLGNGRFDTMPGTPLTVSYSLGDLQRTNGGSDFSGEGLMFGGVTSGGGNQLTPSSIYNFLGTVGMGETDALQQNSFFSGGLDASGTPLGGINVKRNLGMTMFSNFGGLETDTTQGMGAYLGELTLNFSQGVTNPLLQLAGLGGSGDASWTTNFELVGAYDASHGLLPDAQLRLLSGDGDLAVNGKSIYNSASSFGSTTAQGGAGGTVAVTGHNISAITLKVFIKSDVPLSDWDKGFANGDGFVLGVSATPSPSLNLQSFERCGVSSVVVNEGSPYALFEVKGFEGGSIVSLELSSGTGTRGVDTGNTLQYFNGNRWVDHVPGQRIDFADNGNGTPGELAALLVRVAITQDATLESSGGVGEQLTLSVIYGNAETESGQLTILDDGRGQVFGALNTSGVPDVPGASSDPSVPAALADSRSLKVSDVTVNEGSPYALFTVKSAAGKQLNLSLSGNGATQALPGTDTGSGSGAEALEYWDGKVWRPYTGTITVNDAMHTGLSPCMDEGESVNFDRSRVVVASFHSAFYKSADGSYYITGGDADPTGGNFSVPVRVSPENGFSYTGTIIDVAAAGANQHLLMTTEGLWAWGREDIVIHDKFTSSRKIEKVDLPTAIDPAEVRFISASTSGLSMVMTDGTVWVNASSWSSRAFLGDASASNEGDFRQVMTAPGVPLKGVTDLEMGAGGIFAYSSSDNTFYTWGPKVLLGDGTGNARKVLATAISSPLPDAVDFVQLGVTGDDENGSNYFVLGSDGRIYTMGINTQGTTGQGHRNPVLSWTTVRNTAGTGPLENVEFISVASSWNEYPTASAILTDGTLLSWGSNAKGMIGVDLDGNPLTIESRSLLPKQPSWVDGAVPVSVVENGGHFTVAIPRDLIGVTSAVGHNPGGAFGDGSIEDRSAYVLGDFAVPGDFAFASGQCPPLPGADVDVLVRVAIKQDTGFESRETFKLNANHNDGPVASGVGTIMDDGTGSVFGPLNHTGKTDAPGRNGIAANFVKDDDRPLFVDNVTVNEASLYIVYTVSGKEGQLLSLNTQSGTAELGQDTGTQLQYLSESCKTLPTTLDVLANDAVFEGRLLNPASVRLFLTAQGGTGSNTLTLPGQGTWQVNPSGTVTFTPVAGLPDTAFISPVYYAVQDSAGYESDRALIKLGAGETSAATGAVMGASALGRYVRIEQPSNYLALAEVQVFSNGTNVAQGKPATQSSVGWGGVAEYAVDGNTSGNLDGNTVAHTETDFDNWWELDLGSPTAIDKITVWNRDWDEQRIDGAVVQILDDNRNVVASYNLAYKSGDPRSQNKYFAPPPTPGKDGGELDEQCEQTWKNYTPGMKVALPDDDDSTTGEDATMLVRLALRQDLRYEVSESFSLQAINAGGASATGIGTIVDDGSGLVFADVVDDPATPANEAAGPNGTPLLDSSTPRDDDRPLSVTGGAVYEASGYLGFTVSGIEGQPLGLALRSGTATAGLDTAPDINELTPLVTPLQYWSGNDWIDYDPANPPVIPQTGNALDGELASLQVRVKLLDDGLLEPTESLDLVATNRSGVAFAGTGFILDGGVTPILSEPPLNVSSVKVYEGAGGLLVNGTNYTPMVFSVGGVPGQKVALSFDNQTSEPQDTVMFYGSGSRLEYFDETGGNVWRQYTGPVDIPADGNLSVRLAVVQDGRPESTETLTLTATTATGLSSTGTGTVWDTDTVGGMPDVDSFQVNEGSPFAVFTVTGLAGAGMDLSLASGTATAGLDYTSAMEFFDAASASWVSYNPAAPNAVMQPGGRLLVRVALGNDAPYEGLETFHLTARYNSSGMTAGITVGGSHTGTASILDDGTGQIFLTRHDDPLTPANEANLGVMDGHAPQIDAMMPADDDRGVRVDDVTVNEGSPYIVFSLDSLVGEKLKVAVFDGTATLGTDTGTALEYWNGSAWVPYTPDTYIDVTPDQGQLPGDPQSVKVRLAVVNDNPLEVSEFFTIQASTATGKSDTATGTILDNGTGTLWNFATPNSDLGTSQTAQTPTQGFDDDRPFNPAFINALNINEGSPWAVFTINGLPTAQITLSLPAGTGPNDATLGVDYASGTGPRQLQVFVDGQWVDYDPQAPYPTSLGTPTGTTTSNAVLDANGQLLVRVKVNDQVPLEGDEPFGLNLAYTGNWALQVSQTQAKQPDTRNVYTGFANIVDDGSGLLFGSDNTTGLPDALGDPANADPSLPTLLDDDRPLVVGDTVVNEGSPYIVMSVIGKAGQMVKLDLTDTGSATLADLTNSPADVSNTLAYWNGTSWQPYVPGSFVQIPTLPGQAVGSEQSLLVRMGVVNDARYEHSETFTLTATNAGGMVSAPGTGTVLDNGEGVVFGTGGAGNPAGVALDPNTGLFSALTLPTAPLNDDRPVQVSSVTVNEGSPFAVFTVTAAKGAPMLLSLDSGTAQVGTDTGSGIEYLDPVSSLWLPYQGQPVTMPADGSGVTVPLLVRVAIVADPLNEGEEDFMLTAAYANGGQASAQGTGFIVDDGTGDYFATRADDPATPANEAVSGVNLDGTPATRPLASAAQVDPASSMAALADDDRPLTVNDVTVNEGSPFAVFTVGGTEGQYVRLDLTAASASSGSDFVNALEYWNGDSWMAYTPGTFVRMPSNNTDTDELSNLLVRVAVNQDNPFEGRETLNLKVGNTGGAFVIGEGAILDDGEGQLFGPDNRTAQPDSLTDLGLRMLDDDRVAVPAPQQLAPAPASVEVAVVPVTPPALHVQVAVAEGRQAVSVTAPGSSAGLVTSRAISGVGEGRNELHRTDLLIDKFDRVTDPHLYVLPEVKSTRGQAFDAAVPAFTLQSGLLAEEIAPVGSRAFNVQLSAAFTPPELTLADQTLAELMQAPVPVQMADAEEPSDAQRLAQKQALARGQFGFSQQLQMSAAKRGAQSNAQSHTPWARPLA